MFDNIVHKQKETRYKVESLTKELKQKEESYKKVREIANRYEKDMEKQAVEIGFLKSDLKKCEDEYKSQKKNNISYETKKQIVDNSSDEHDDEKYRKLMEAQKKLDQLRKNYDDRLNELDRLKIDNDDLKFKYEELKGRMEIAIKKEETFV